MGLKPETQGQPRELLDCIISVIVPVYNVEEWLEECIDSIVGQMPGSVEVVLIDDGSTDNSGKICDEYAERFDFVRVYHTPNGGLSKARNVGVTHASGKYITFVDSDDMLTEGALKLMYDRAEETNADIVVGNAKRYSPARGTWNSQVIKHFTKKIPKDVVATTFVASPYLTFHLLACAKLIRRDFYVDKAAGFLEGFYYEDEPVMTGLYFEAKTIGIVRDTVYLWRVRDGASNLSITQRAKDKKMVSDRITLLDSVRREYESRLSMDDPSHKLLRQIRMYKWLDFDCAFLLKQLSGREDELRDFTWDTIRGFIQAFADWPEFKAALAMVRPINRLKINALMDDNRDTLRELHEYHNGEYRQLRRVQSAEVRMYKKLLIHCRGIGVKLIARGATMKNLKKLHGMGIRESVIRLDVTRDAFKKISKDSQLADMYSIRAVRYGILKRKLVIRYPEHAAEHDLEYNGRRPEIHIYPNKELPELTSDTIKSEKFEYTAMYRLR